MNDIKLTILENENNKHHIIMLTEIIAKNSKYRLNENELKLPGYKFYSKNIFINNCQGIVLLKNIKL